MVSKVLVLALIGLLTVNVVSALKCYQCDGCDGKKTEDLKECKDDPFSTPAPEIPPTDEPSNTTSSTVIPPTTEDPSNTTATDNPSNTTSSIDINSTDSTNQTYSLLERVYLNKYDRKDGDEEAFSCLTYTKDKKIYRACTKNQCKSIEENKEITECKLCNEEGCNFGTNIQSWAFSTVILVAIVKYLL